LDSKQLHSKQLDSKQLDSKQLDSKQSETLSLCWTVNSLILLTHGTTMKRQFLSGSVQHALRSVITIHGNQM
jgi:hypothetical protein